MRGEQIVPGTKWTVKERLAWSNLCPDRMLTGRVCLQKRPFANTLELVIQRVFHDAHELRSRVAFIYDRSDAELLALPLRHVGKEYGAHTIGNLGIAVFSLDSLGESAIHS